MIAGLKHDLDHQRRLRIHQQISARLGQMLHILRPDRRFSVMELMR